MPDTSIPALLKQNIRDEHREKFSEATVNDYKTDPESVTSGGTTPARHYSQVENPPSKSQVETLLGRLDIPYKETTFLLWAGYTGQLADTLHSLGGEIIFTDPIMDWVENARENGFEAHQTTLEACPGELIERAGCITSFEGYMPFNDSQLFLYESLRCLTAPYGRVFFESELTRQQLKDAGGGKTIKSTFSPFEDVYGIKNRYRERDGLRAYHIQADADTREQILSDVFVTAATIVKATAIASEQDSQTPVSLTHQVREEIAEVSDTHISEVEDVHRRLVELHWGTVPKQMKKYYQRNQVHTPSVVLRMTEL